MCAKVELMQEFMKKEGDDLFGQDRSEGYYSITQGFKPTEALTHNSNIIWGSPYNDIVWLHQSRPLRPNGLPRLRATIATKQSHTVATVWIRDTYYLKNK